MFGGEPLAMLLQFLAGLSAPFGLASFSWLWLYFLPFGFDWFVWLGFTASLVDYIISALSLLERPRYRMRRRKWPPDKSRRLSGKKRRALLRERRRFESQYLAAINKWYRDRLEKDRLELELMEFLDFNGVPLKLQGKFKLWKVNEVLLNAFLKWKYPDWTVPNWVFYERRWVFYNGQGPDDDSADGSSGVGIGRPTAPDRMLGAFGANSSNARTFCALV